MKMCRFNLSPVLCGFFCIFVFEALAAEGTAETSQLKDEERAKDHDFEDSISKSIFSFGMDLMKGLIKKSGPEENIFVSPFGAYLTLSLVQLAAEGETRAELNRIMNLSNNTLDTSKLHKTLGDYLKKVINQPSTNHSRVFPEIAFSSGLFALDSFPLNNSYVQMLKKYYDHSANATNVDFRGHAKESTETMNLWISRSTKNRITNFFNESLANDTSAMLTSAFYFKASWKHPFANSVNELSKFKTGHAEIEVPILQKVGEVPYYSNAQLKFDSIELLFEGEEHGMMFVLPHPSQTVNNLTEHFHLMDFKQYESSLKRVSVHYKIPKMKMFSKHSLLEALHLENSFKSADLRAMSTNASNVTIGDLRQGSQIEIDEKGSTATIASSAMEYVLVKGGPIFRQPVQFFVNRPFIVYIRHLPSRTLVFGGIIRKPPVESKNQSRLSQSGHRRLPMIIPVPVPIPMHGPQLKTPEAKIKVPKVKVKPPKLGKHKG